MKNHLIFALDGSSYPFLQGKLAELPEHASLKDFDKSIINTKDKTSKQIVQEATELHSQLGGGVLIYAQLQPHINDKGIMGEAVAQKVPFSVWDVNRLAHPIHIGFEHNHEDAPHETKQAAGLSAIASSISVLSREFSVIEMKSE